MSQQRKIIFFGEDIDYVSEGLQYAKHLSSSAFQYEFQVIAPNAESTINFYEYLKSNDCLLIILDFTHQHLNPQSWLSQLRHLKNHAFYRKVVFAGIFKDKLGLEEAQTILQFGLNYMHVKGSDISQFFNDCSYIAYESQYKKENYARVKDLRLPYHLTMLNFISRISEDGIRINCDLETDQDELTLTHSVLGTPLTNQLKVDNRFSGSEIPYSLSSYDLHFKFSSPWDEPDANDIKKEDYLDLIDSDQTLRDPDRNLIIWTLDDSLYEKLSFIKLHAGLKLHLTQLALESSIDSIDPELLIIDFPVDSSESYSEYFWKILKPQAERTTEPFLVIFNSPISTTDFKIQFNYQKVLCRPEPCTISSLESLINLYIQKNTISHSGNSYKIFSDQNSRSFAEMSLPITVTSLTEHEITFYFETELPLFSVFKLDVPVSCHVLIIPPYFDLQKREDKYHHMGIIMGLDHEESMTIRTFVNQAIFEPLEKFEIPVKGIVAPDVQLLPPSSLEDEAELIVEKKESTSSAKKMPASLKEENFKLRANFKQSKL